MTVEILAQRVRYLFTYDPLTGIFIRNVRLAQRHHAGDRGDFEINSGPMLGYRRVSFDSARYLAHRVAWLYVYGAWPSKHLDHINGDKSDNRIANLRDADDTLNLENLRVAKRQNLSGMLGVSTHRQGRFVARIVVHGKPHYLGIYDTPEEAHVVYLEAKRRMHEGCTI